MKLVFLEPPNLRFSTRLDFSTASLLAETPQNLPTNIDAVEPAMLTLIKAWRELGVKWITSNFPSETLEAISFVSSARRFSGSAAVL